MHRHNLGFGFMVRKQLKKHSFFPHDEGKLIKKLGKKVLTETLQKMLLVRNFEMRGEAAYQQGKMGGFFHSYMGQEAVQAAAIAAMGADNWWSTTYRCHGLALLLGATPNELMAELYGRATGIVKGVGGSMHFFHDHLLGGLAIVGGHVPVATGAAFSIKYKKEKGKAAICFLGDGAVAQGSIHEAWNLASLWELPCIYVIENNQWGMGTAVDRAICVEHLAEDKAPGYNMKGYTFDGMDFFNSYAGFDHVYKETLKTGRPALVEVITERFRGHSISDPGLYRTKESLEECKKRDPLLLMKKALIKAKMLDEKTYKELDKKMREIAIEATKFADDSPWPDSVTLEEGIFAP